MTSPLVARSVALAKLTHHQFIPGMGYLAHSGPPELPASAKSTKNCLPPAGTVDGSMHLIRPPTGADPVRMYWIHGERAWGAERPQGGNRMAWPVDYLMRAGWEYEGPA